MVRTEHCWRERACSMGVDGCSFSDWMTTFCWWVDVITWLSAALYCTVHTATPHRTIVLGRLGWMQQKYRHFASQSIDPKTKLRFSKWLRVIFVINSKYLRFSYCHFHWQPSLQHLQDCLGDFLPLHTRQHHVDDPVSLIWNSGVKLRRISFALWIFQKRFFELFEESP